MEPTLAPPDPLADAPLNVQRPPAPLRGGPLAFLRFARARRMLRLAYIPLIARWLWLRLRWRGRLTTDGIAFVCRDVTFEIGPDAHVHLGRWSWLGDGCKIRAHEGRIAIGAQDLG